MSTILWRSDRLQLFEYCSLKDTLLGPRYEGIVLSSVDDKPLRITYQVTCDERGLTSSVNVYIAGAQGERQIDLSVDEHRTWRLNGRELPDCRGLADVDLGFSPATNSLPIRRLSLNVGDSLPLTTTWVRFPEFDVLPFPQRYTRLDTSRYLYESQISDFKAELVVNDDGLVTKYGDYWEAIASSG